MTGSRKRPVILIAGLLLGLLAVTLQGVQGEDLENIPSEDQCRPYIEKALKDLGTEGSQEEDTSDGGIETASDEDKGPEESAADENDGGDESGTREKREVTREEQEETSDNDNDDGSEATAENETEQDQAETVEVTSDEAGEEGTGEQDTGSVVVIGTEEDDSKGEDEGTQEAEDSKEQKSEQQAEGKSDSGEVKTEEEITTEGESGEQTVETSNEQGEETTETEDKVEDNQREEQKSGEEETEEAHAESVENDTMEVEVTVEDSKQEDGYENDEEDKKSVENEVIVAEDDRASVEAELKTDEVSEESKEHQNIEDQKSVEDEKSESITDDTKSTEGETKEEDGVESNEGEVETESKEGEVEVGSKEGEVEIESKESVAEGETKEASGESKEGEIEGENKDGDTEEQSTEGEEKGSTEGESGESEGEESTPEEELIMEIEIPDVLRPRDHIGQLLKLDEENEEKEKAVEKVADVILKDLKRLYDNAIKPLETLYKYRDLSNRHFGDPEIFSKPLVLFMGPWSGGKSSIINYLLDIEYKSMSLRTGAEPSPAYFNILMHGEEEEILDGTQLAADWTFSGLQKFGQGLLDRLKGYRLNNKLLEKVNIVEIPGILEIRKQVQRLFPFNDACQWFIDRADIIFLVYDPSKLDVGPETEAILDQLKGREYQTRIILNKADQVKPEELMRVQGALIWNISPLMSSAEPPIMYSTSLWSIPYEVGAPTRLLYAQERAFLRDLRSAVDKRVEHKIASARRFAVRVRNHAKMVDCYLTTYYNHKSFFAKKKDVSDRIIENPQDYHIYEGLSTLTNISRYDLPDPDVYRDFFRLNSLYDFPLLSSTCTYFRGCPINRLDVAIAYDLPELIGKYKKSVEAVIHQEEKTTTPAPQAQAQIQQQGKAKSGASKMSLS